MDRFARVTRTYALTSALAALGGCETTGGGPGQPMTATPNDATATEPDPAAPAEPAYGLPPLAFTLVNLHPDEERRQLYSVNYQQLGLIKRCTPVTIDATTDRAVLFTVTETGRQYTYSFHDTLTEDHATHLARYFGANCPALPSSLNAKDKKGIELGLVSEGMTKEGVIFAIGFPPPHATPGPDSDQWMYWKNRWDRFVVRFSNGVVIMVQN